LLSVGTIYPDGAEKGEPLLDIRIVAAGAGPFRSIAGNVAIEPHASLETIGHVDVAIVCHMYMPVDTAPRGRYSAEIAWLRKVHAHGALLCSVCSGSLVLAEAGLLDGRQCAGPGAYRDLFRTAYPKVDFTVDPILSLESEDQGIVTAASVSAWEDLALYVITRLCGADHALRAARAYLLSSPDDRQLPFATITRRGQNADRVIAQCQQWIAQNYASAKPVAAMVERSGLSRRTFMRRFRAATGYLPLEYVQTLRIEEAKQIIESETENLDDVGVDVGYDDPSSFRRLFKRQTGLTPAAYRRKFTPITNLGFGASRTRHS
jgi:transcriptional regulator GlxA family with amidase domain